MSEIIYIPKLARNALFAHLGAPRGCQIVVLSVHMPKTRHFGRIFGRKTVRTTTEFGLARLKQEIICLKLFTYPSHGPKMPVSPIYTHLGDAKVWCYRFICPKPGTLDGYLGEKRPENGPSSRTFTRL
jgi:hypothetical protein